MPAVTGNHFPVGLRYASLFELNANGRINATSPSAVYEGVQIVGAQAFTVTVPEPRRITHPGDDRVLQTDALPPTEAASGELRVSRISYAANAILAGVNVNTIAESKEFPYGTDQQGFEPLVGLHMYQQSVDETGSRRWRSFIFPKAKAIPTAPGMSENPEPLVYKVTPYIVTNRLWGTTLVLATDGIIETQVFEYMTQGKPKLVGWKGDGVEETFVFPTAAPAFATTKVAVFVDGVLQTSGITVTTAQVVFAVPPVANADISIWYEATY